MYKKELQMMIVLLALGFLLAITLALFTKNTYSGTTVQFGLADYALLLMFICYPVGIVYGWRKMLKYLQ